MAQTFDCTSTSTRSSDIGRPPIPSSLPPPISRQIRSPLEIGIRELSATDRHKRRDEKKLMLFIILFSINLCVIIALLVLWNIKGISNNITWALLAVCGMAGFSVFCCALYFLVCVNDWDAVTSAICCCRSGTHRPSRQTSGAPRFFKNVPFSLKKLKNGFAKNRNCYSVQTVFPTPEFYYFSNSPPATFSISRTRERPKLDRGMSSSKESQLSGVAFSAMSTAPASSMLDIAEMCVELERQANQNYFSTLGSASPRSLRGTGRMNHHRSLAVGELNVHASGSVPDDNSSMSSVSPREYETIADEPAHTRTPSTQGAIEGRRASTVPTTQRSAAGPFHHASFLNTSFDDFEYVSIPCGGADRLTEKRQPLKHHNNFSSPVSINVYSGL